MFGGEALDGKGQIFAESNRLGERIVKNDPKLQPLSRCPKENVKQMEHRETRRQAS